MFLKSENKNDISAERIEEVMYGWLIWPTYNCVAEAKIFDRSV
jgi:hypothetical protein